MIIRDHLAIPAHPLAFLRDMPDNYLLNVNLEGMPASSTTEIVVPTAHDLEEAINQLLTDYGAEPTAEYVEPFVEHEAQHANAAHAVGATAAWFTLDIWPVGERTENSVRFRPNHGATFHNISKLAFASVIAHPAALSEGDLLDLRVIGYSLDQVTEKIVMNNLDGGLKSLPLPLSAGAS